MFEMLHAAMLWFRTKRGVALSYQDKLLWTSQTVSMHHLSCSVLCAFSCCGKKSWIYTWGILSYGIFYFYSHKEKIWWVTEGVSQLVKYWCIKALQKNRETIFLHYFRVQFGLEIWSNFKSTEHFFSKFRDLLAILYHALLCKFVLMHVLRAGMQPFTTCIKFFTPISYSGRILWLSRLLTWAE